MSFKVADFVQELCSFLQDMDEVIALWEGGSAATGFKDIYSDLDLVIVTEHSVADSIYARLDEYLSSHFSILRRFRMPEPTWHGMSQCFYLLDSAPPCFYCDISVVDRANPEKLCAYDRHGKAVVHYDKHKIFVSEATDPAELERIQKRVYKMATSLDFIFMLELEKALMRCNWIAANSAYHSFIMRGLIPLMNLKHRPHKADFGIRYIERDYPEQEAVFVADLLSISDIEQIRHKHKMAYDRYQALKASLSESYA
jgi:predicted nucleotidyltransferase